MQGMQKPQRSLLRALSRTDGEMRCLLTDLFCTGQEFAFSQLFLKPFLYNSEATLAVVTSLMPLLALGTDSAQMCPPRARCMQCCIYIILKSALFAGRHLLEGRPSEAALRLINDGVVQIFDLKHNKHALQISASLLEQLLQTMAVEGMQPSVQLHDPPMELGQR